MIKITPERAEAAYAILVEVAGAKDDSGERWSFVRYVTKPVDDGFREWRFQGSLGFGGKFKTQRGGLPIVDCYPEDLNDERAKAIATTNARLAALFAEETPSPP